MLKKTPKDTSKNARKIPGIGLYITTRKKSKFAGGKNGSFISMYRWCNCIHIVLLRNSIYNTKFCWLGGMV